MKASVAYKTLDNITVVMLAFKNFKHALSEEFQAVNNPNSGNSDSKLQISIYLYKSIFALKVIKISWAERVAKSARSTCPRNRASSGLHSLRVRCLLLDRMHLWRIWTAQMEALPSMKIPKP